MVRHRELWGFYFAVVASVFCAGQAARAQELQFVRPGSRATVIGATQLAQAATESPEDGSQDSDATSDDAASENSDRSGETLGQPPPDNSLQFLRGSTVLLETGDIQVEYGLFYSLLQNRFFEPDGFGNLIEVETIDRSFVAPFTLRYGLSEDIQLTGTVPVGLSYVETEDPFFEDSTSLFTVGDVVLGGNFVLGRGHDEAPDILGGLSVIVPTDDGRSGAGGLQPALGSGFWGMAGT